MRLAHVLIAVVLFAAAYALWPSPEQGPPALRGADLPHTAMDAAAAPRGPLPASSRGVTAAVSSRGLPYLLYVPPDCAATDRVPVLLFLHGAGESGGAPAWRLLPGFDPRAGEWVRGAPAPVRGTPPGLALDGLLVGARRAVVIAPVTHRGWGADTHADVLALLDDVLRATPCADAPRVVLTGISMGGNGAWLLGAAAAERFAGVAPVCGWADAEDAPRLASTPIFAAHGKNDVVIPEGESAAAVAAVRAAGNTRVRYDVQEVARAPEGAARMTGHDSWTDFYAADAFWAWVAELEGA